MAIIVKTKIHEGCTGAGVHDQYELKTNPRNLMVAIDEIDSLRERKTSSFGDIGHCGTWIEVDGVSLSVWDEKELSKAYVEEDLNYYRREGGVKPLNRTQRAEKMISSIASGELLADRKASAEWVEKELQTEMDAWDQQPEM
ncbi:hypothetical protein [Stutzerimonas nitrititolerans]|uniref:hypothetical protein n=1 Tax=Stutzerimonas nitrititolerans TaxID=2482751 RepID=UPI0028AABCF8|nr:hypothetical protein [Stutzerimonas nitrititolerans]